MKINIIIILGIIALTGLTTLISCLLNATYNDMGIENETKKSYIQLPNIVVLGVFLILSLVINSGLISIFNNIQSSLINIGFILFFFIFKSSRRFKKNIDKNLTYFGYSNVDGEVYLNENVVLLGIAMKYITWLAIAGSAIVGIVTPIYFRQAEEMTLPVILDGGTPWTSYILFVLFVNEIASYLSGDTLKGIRKKSKEEVKSEEVADDRTEGFLPLYNEAKKIWGKNILADFRPKVIIENEEVPPVIDKRLFENNKELEELYIRLKKEYRITSEGLSILNDLFKKEDIIVENSNYEELAPMLFSYLEESIVKGKKILVLAENNLYYNFNVRNLLKEWFQSWFKKLYKKSIRNILDFSEWLNKNQWDILIGTQNELIKYQEDFIRKIQQEQEDIRDIIILVINENAEELAENILTLSVLTNILNTYFRVDKKRGENGAQYIILSSKASNLNESINKNLGINAKNIKVVDKKADNLYSIVWSANGAEQYYNEIMNGTYNYNIGVSNLLSYLPWSQGYEKAEFIDQDVFPYAAYKNMAEVLKTNLKERPIDSKKLKGVYDYFADYTFISSIIKREDHKLLYIFDKNNNFPCLLEKYASLGRKEALINVVVPTYLLKDYFVDNIEYFCSSPIYGYTPKIESDQFKVASYLKEVLTNDKLTISEDDIKRELLTYKNEIGNIEEEIVNLFKEIYLIDILKNDYLTVTNKQVYNSETKKFEEKKYFKMNSVINEHSYFKWFENYEVIDTGKNVYELIPFEHIYQNYLPDQIHSFNGNAFKIDKIDTINKKVNISPTENGKSLIYRNKDNIILNDIVRDGSEIHSEKESEKYKIYKKISTVNYEIDTEGYFEFMDGINLSNQDYKYVNLKTSSDISYARQYENGKMLSISITSKKGEVENYDSIAITFSLLLTEIFKTMFPGNNKYIKVFTTVAEDFFGDSDSDVVYSKYIVPETLAQVIPSSVVIEKSKYQDIVQDNSSNQINLYFIEDSHKDVGILQAIKDNFEDILEILQDYLNWLLTENTTPEKGWNKMKITQFDKMSYLKYGKNEISEFLSIKETRNYLNEILGENKYTNNRASYYSVIIDDETEDEFDKEYNYLKSKIRAKRGNN